MPLRGKRGSSSISRKLNGGKQKQSSTSHLHPRSSLYCPPLNANENLSQDESDSDAGTLPEPKREKNAKNNNIIKEKNTLIKSLEKQVLALEKQVLVADEEATKKVTLANVKLDASLAREEATKAASQKAIDVLVTKSKSKVKDDAMRAAQALEKERNTWRKKLCRQDEKYAKVLEREKAENEKREKKLNESASKKQLAMTNEINDLKAKVLTDIPSNESICLVGDGQPNRPTSVQKVILMIHNLFLHIFIMLSYLSIILSINLQSNPPLKIESDY